jgi:predicted kinase
MNANHPDVIVVRGAPGSGKTLTTKCLARRFPGGVRIEVDTLRSMVISVNWTSQPEHIAILSLSAELVVGFLRLGYGPVLVDDTFSGDKLAAFVAQLRSRQPDIDARLFALTTEPTVLDRRVESRPADHFKDRGICQRLNADVPRHMQPGELLIDNSALTPEQTADAILTGCRRPPQAAAPASPEAP